MLLMLTNSQIHINFSTKAFRIKSIPPDIYPKHIPFTYNIYDNLDFALMWKAQVQKQ